MADQEETKTQRVCRKVSACIDEATAPAFQSDPSRTIAPKFQQSTIPMKRKRQHDQHRGDVQARTYSTGKQNHPQRRRLWTMDSTPCSCGGASSTHAMRAKRPTRCACAVADTGKLLKSYRSHPWARREQARHSPLRRAALCSSR